MKGPAARIGGDLAYRYGPALATGLLLLAAWEVLPGLLGVPELLIPRASLVAAALWNQIERGLILDGLSVTLVEALSGFAIGSSTAVVAAALVTRSPLVERALLPYLVGLQALPKVALAPLLVVWLGFGIASKIAVATIIAFFPVLINAMIGFTTVEPGRLELMRSLVASEWQVFRIVRFPNALPFIFAGLNVAIVLSVTGALVGEFIGAKRGLGTLLLQFNFNLDIAGMFAVLLVLGLMGSALHAVVRALHRHLIFWAAPETLQRRIS